MTQKAPIIPSAATIPGIIILAGGFGTRLRNVVADVPKCMAPVHGKPFLSYVIEYFRTQGIRNFIFSLGYKHEMIIEYLERTYSSPILDRPLMTFEYSIEDHPLGTGGAIKKACTYCTCDNILITNGDTLFAVDTEKVLAFHIVHDADCTIGVKPMKHFSRYGVIKLKRDRSVKNFSEKKYYREGLINGGFYVLNVRRFLHESLPDKFSFESDYLEQLYHERKMYGLVQDKYFIDIGIPEDYARAQTEFQTLKF